GSGDGTLRVWDIATAKQRLLLGTQRHSVGAIALSPDGKVLASCGGCMIHRWDVATGKEIPLPEGHEDCVFSITFSPDGKTVVSGSVDAIYRWDAGTGEALGQFDPDPDYRVHDPMRFCMSSDATSVAVCREGGKGVRLWDVVPGKEPPS